MSNVSLLTKHLGSVANHPNSIIRGDNKGLSLKGQAHLNKDFGASSIPEVPTHHSTELSKAGDLRFVLTEILCRLTPLHAPVDSYKFILISCSLMLA